MSKSTEISREGFKYPDGSPGKYDATGQPLALSEVKRQRKVERYWSRRGAQPLSLWPKIKAKRYSMSGGTEAS